MSYKRVFCMVHIFAHYLTKNKDHLQASITIQVILFFTIAIECRLMLWGTLSYGNKSVHVGVLCFHISDCPDVDNVSGSGFKLIIGNITPVRGFYAGFLIIERITNFKGFCFFDSSLIFRSAMADTALTANHLSTIFDVQISSTFGYVKQLFKVDEIVKEWELISKSSFTL